MQFLPAICPTCSGSLQLPNDRETVQCMYCGNTVIVKQAVAAASGVNTANYLTLAKKASEAGNSKEAYDYYTKLLEYEPNSSEAWFGKAEAAGWMSTLADFRVTEMISGFDHAVSVSPESERSRVARRANESLNSVSNAFYSTARNHLLEYVALNNSWTDYLGQCQLILLGLEKAHEFDPTDKVTIENIITVCVDNITGVKYSDPYENDASKVWFLSDSYEKDMRQKMGRYVVKMQKLDPTYTPPEAQRKQPNACFVATATMDDFDHPYVLLLREFRNEVLEISSVGRKAISIYYSVGPVLALGIRSSTFLKSISRLVVIRPSVWIARRALIDRRKST